MLKFSAALLLLLFCLSGRQPDPTAMVPQSAAVPMCHDPNNALDRFAAFAEDPLFRAAHPAPQPLTLHKPKGAMIEFPVEGGPAGRGYLVKSRRKSQRYLLLFHEWWGLNDNIKNEAEKWSKELKINVLALDLYDRKLATTAEEAGKLMQGNDAGRSSAILAGAVRHLGDKADFRTMGWCFGGGWSLKAALQLGSRAKACVVYYGMPEQDVAKLKTLATDVLFLHAERDKWITDEVVGDFEKNMRAAGKKVAVQRYDADHAFANPTSPRYNEPAAVASRKAVTAYLLGK